MYAQQLKEEKVGQIVQSEFSRDGRSIITLEVDRQTSQRRIKVWYNNNTVGDASEVDRKDEPLSKADGKDRLLRLRHALSLLSLDGLDFFELPAQRGTIRYFK